MRKISFTEIKAEYMARFRCLKPDDQRWVRIALVSDLTQRRAKQIKSITDEVISAAISRERYAFARLERMRERMRERRKQAAMV